ncbi:MULTISPECIES: DUF4013 domain-containing protein [unclassified Haladaptatus]|uniref:DUF4013 domain-containing protein n=1 Tax=unclassified Haladaptatus TaxID=2622732 RepID=UPI0023E79433|nr:MULTISPECIES: DUF4013 domain-containing protein [unclassified Haladaptatus]
MLSEALSYPRNGDNWLKTIAIGGVLTLLSFLIVPIFLVQGYFMRILRSAVRGEAGAPEFDEWMDLLTEGLMSFVIALVYVGIPGIIFTVGMFVLGFGAVAGAQTGSSGLMAGLGIVGLLFGLVMFVVLLLAGYVVPAAMANFATKQSFGAGFEFGTVMSIALTSDYLVAWLLAIVVSIVLGTIAGMLTAILVGIFLLFYVQMMVYYLYGRGYANAQETTGPRPTAQTAD